MRSFTRNVLLVLVSVMLLMSTACSNSSNDAQDVATNESTRTVYRVGMEVAYAPNNWQEDTQTETNLPIENLPGFYAEGYDVQMAKLIGEYLDADIVIVKLAWEGLIEALNQGQIDMIIAGMADTEERKQSIAFSDSYSVQKTEYCMLVTEDGGYADATSLADFAGASVLGQKGTRYDEVIDQIEGVDHLPPVDTVANMLSRLEAGTADALVVDTETGEAYLDAYPDFTIVYFEEGQGFNIGFTGACVGMRLEDTELVEQVNAALAAIDHDTRDQLSETAKANMPQ